MTAKFSVSAAFAAFFVGAALLATSASPAVDPDQPTAPVAPADEKEEWIPLFNGKNLDGWTPKFTGCELGQNYLDTVRVEDGVMRIAYDKYESFEGRFGHIFYRTPVSDYRLRVEYRFVGRQCPGGPGWAFRNSGVMIHSQAPDSMRKDQDFPVSIEVQLLGGDGTNERHNANLCTPGTNVVYKGNLHKQHCTDSSSETYHGDRWVTVEIEVHNHELIRHIIDGKTVLEYSAPQLDADDPDAKELLETQDPLLDGGYISLQAESHPIEFRRVEILPLDND